MTAASNRSPGEPRLAFRVQEVADVLGVSRELVKLVIRTANRPRSSSAVVGSSAARPSSVSWPAEMTNEHWQNDQGQSDAAEDAARMLRAKRALRCAVSPGRVVEGRERPVALQPRADGVVEDRIQVRAVGADPGADVGMPLTQKAAVGPLDSLRIDVDTAD